MWRSGQEVTDDRARGTVFKEQGERLSAPFSHCQPMTLSPSCRQKTQRQGERVMAWQWEKGAERH